MPKLEKIHLKKVGGYIGQNVKIATKMKIVGSLS